MPWAPDYVTSADLKGDLRITDNGDDAQVARAITAASRAVDRATNRQFGLVDAAEDRIYPASWRRGRWLVKIDDLMTETGFTVTTVDGTVTAYRLHPVNAAAEGRPWTRLVIDPASPVQPTGEPYEEITVTAKFGWATVPDTVKEATLLQASRFFKRRDAPFGVAGSPDQGSEMRLLAKVDPDVAVMLADYVRDPVVFG